LESSLEFREFGNFGMEGKLELFHFLSFPEEVILKQRDLQLASQEK
jgi:hypothetical protein